jgi:hypothetical protein
VIRGRVIGTFFICITFVEGLVYAKKANKLKDCVCVERKR